jgi:outer membrane biosynthesis protein TonB
MSESDISTEPATFEGEPTRWLDDPTTAASLRADLAHGASATAGGIDYAASLVALRGAIAAQTGALAPAAIAGKSLGLKIALGGVLAIGAAAAWWATAGEPRNDAAATHVARPVAVAPAPAEPVVDDAPRAPEPRTPAVVAVEPTAAPAPEVVATPDVEPTDADKVRKPKPNERPSDKPAESDDDRYLREAKLVAQARKLLGTSPAQALASTNKHAKEFPKGALVEEARAIEIRALAKLGRMDDAQRKADDFLSAFGDGAHAAAVRRAIAGDDDVQ